MGDGGVEGLSAIGDGGQGAIPLMPERTFASSKVHNLKVRTSGTYCIRF